MRTPYAIVLLLSMLLGGTYWYSSVEAVCRLPVYYTIGTVDPRFGLEESEVRMILSEAESIWEEATGRNLFTYSDTASLLVNFIYDERQQSALEAERLKTELDAKENVNDALGETYAELITQYQEKELEYKSKKEAYERKLSRYNEEVKQYNQSGGAPQAVYDRLEIERQALDRELNEINTTARNLNNLSDKINKIGERGNELIRQYNDTVERFNDSYGTSEEFTQGDYQGNSINIYTFKDMDELVLVLAHEFGHALSIDHVENEESIMHYLMGGQPDTLELSQEDITAFSTVCGDVTTYERLRERMIKLLQSYGVL